MLAVFVVAGVAIAADRPPPEWSGAGNCRVLIHLPAGQVGAARPGDEQVASCALEFSRYLESQGLAGSVHLASLQLHRYDPQSGRPLEWIGTELDHPCRFQDDRLPEIYPSRVGRASETPDGRPPLVQRLRKGRLFNREMNPDQGVLIWSHREVPGCDAHYALYFDLQSQRQGAGCISPAPWIGDADVLRREQGAPLGGFSHFTATTADLNGDGLADLVAGTEKGDLLWFPNRGSVRTAEFLGCHVLQDEDGPIDTGWYAAPFVYDWDDDGLLDLLVGTSGNVIVWWQNEGTVERPRFAYRGFVLSDGQRLEVPQSPVAEDPAGIFARDYYNQPWVGDLDGDGLPDIVTGGYTTGQIHWFGGRDRAADGTVQLEYQGTLDTANGPIDTVWAAAPWVTDADADGIADLLTGGWWWSGIPTPPGPGDADLLRFYRGQPGATGRFERCDFPRQGEFPSGQIARPSLIDADDDELADLVISTSGGSVYLAANKGTAGGPVWQMPAGQLTAPWGFTRDWDATASQGDVDGDGVSECLLGDRLWQVGGTAQAPTREGLGQVHVGGRPIKHPGPGYGDPYQFTLLFDWNEDGRADLLWGTHQGQIYVHLKSGGEDPLAFEPANPVMLVDGAELRVGPPVVEHREEARDFTILQGSRIVFAVTDFDGDGVVDLIVGDTFAQLRVFLGTPVQDGYRFRTAEPIAKLPTRPESICCTDWDGDGKVDLLIGGPATDPVILYANASEVGQPALASAQPLADLPYLFWGPRVAVADWNEDGDVDLLVQSEFFSFWIERSFLEHGYRQATPIAVEVAGNSIPIQPSR